MLKVARVRRRLPGAAACGLLAIASTLALAGSAQATSGRGPARSVPPRCSTAVIRTWVGLGGAGGYAGGVYLPLEFTNTGSRTCTLLGYPAAAVYRAGRHPLAPRARHLARTRPHLVTLLPGSTAHAVLQVANAAAACRRPASSTALRVTPPGQHAAQQIGIIISVCPQRRTLRTGPVRPGVGVP